MCNKSLKKDVYKIYLSLEKSKDLLKMWSGKKKVEWTEDIFFTEHSLNESIET